MWGKTRGVQSFSSVKMRGLSPSVESVIMLLGVFNFFFEVIIQMLIDG